MVRCLVKNFLIERKVVIDIVPLITFKKLEKNMKDLIHTILKMESFMGIPYIFLRVLRTNVVVGPK